MSIQNRIDNRNNKRITGQQFYLFTKVEQPLSTAQKSYNEYMNTEKTSLSVQNLDSICKALNAKRRPQTHSQHIHTCKHTRKNIPSPPPPPYLTHINHTHAKTNTLSLAYIEYRTLPGHRSFILLSRATPWSDSTLFNQQKMFFIPPNMFLASVACPGLCW